MPNLDATIQNLTTIFKRLEAARQSRRETQDASISFDLRDELIGKADAEVRDWETMVAKVLEEFRRFPPQHGRHFPTLEAFHQNGSYDKSVFLMTKFPEGHESVDMQLHAVINAVVESIRQCGYEARLASDKRHHSLLWDNVEVYLLGSSRGVAIVEDRYKPELNPNVAMEWGWMRGMGKDVLYLVEETFSHPRADWSGLVEERFCWERPREQIRTAVEKWIGEGRA